MLTTLRLCAVLGALTVSSTAGLAAQSEGSTGKPALAEVAAAAQAAWEDQDFAAAAEAYARITAARPEDGTAWHRLGYSLHALGRLDAALEAHRKAAAFPEFAAVATYNVACVHALQGETDRAFAALEKAAEAGFASVVQIDNDTDLDSLRADPRFAAYRTKLQGMAQAGRGVRAFTADTPRVSSRLLFWGQGGSPGQIVVDYGQPVWKPEYREAVESGQYTGKRWRLGKDFWTTLDTNLDLVVGGVEVPAGHWYLTLEQRDDGSFGIAFHDPAEVRTRRLDAFQASYLEGGITAPLAHAVRDEITEKLGIGIANASGDNTRGALTIRFGPYELTAPVEIALGK